MRGAISSAVVGLVLLLLGGLGLRSLDEAPLNRTGESDPGRSPDSRVTLPFTSRALVITTPPATVETAGPGIVARETVAVAEETREAVIESRGWDPRVERRGVALK
jgi:hypothetical protein